MPFILAIIIAITAGNTPAQPFIPIVVPSVAVKFAVGELTPTSFSNVSIVTGKVPMLEVVVNDRTNGAVTFL